MTLYPPPSRLGGCKCRAPYPASASGAHPRQCECKSSIWPGETGAVERVAMRRHNDPLRSDSHRNATRSFVCAGCRYGSVAHRPTHGCVDVVTPHLGEARAARDFGMAAWRRTDLRNGCGPSSRRTRGWPRVVAPASVTASAAAVRHAICTRPGRIVAQAIQTAPRSA